MGDPAEGIKDLLVSAGVGTFAAQTGWGIFIFKEPMSPDTVVTVFDTGGLSSNPKWLLDFPSVQVRVRGAIAGYQASYTKAREVLNALIGLPSQVINGDRWVAINQIGGIIGLGFDDNGRPMWTLNFALIIEPATGTHREAL